MIQGPSAGPAMVLNILMRWPFLIVVCALGGLGAAAYDQVGIDPAIHSFKAFAMEVGLLKAEQAVQAVKKTDLLPTATAAPQRVASPEPAITEQAIAPAEKTPSSLTELERLLLQSSRVARVVVADSQ